MNLSLDCSIAPHCSHSDSSLPVGRCRYKCVSHACEVVPQEIQPPSGRRSIADQKRSHFLLSTDVLPTALIPTGSSISGDAASALVASSMSDDPFSAFDVSLSLSGMLSTLPSSPQLKAPTPSPVMRLSKGQVKPTSSTLPATLNSTTDRPLFNKNHVAGQESSPDPVLPHAAVDLFRQHSAHVPPESKPESKSEATVSLNTHKVRYASYFSRIKHKIKQGWFYPAQARRNKLYGRVHLIFSIRRDGHLMRVNVVNSSGVQILDRAAMRAVKAAGSFGAFPKAWSLKLLHIRATFEYLRRKTQ